MICVGIDVSKDKHDCFILSSEDDVLADVLTIPNNAEVCAPCYNPFAAVLDRQAK